MTIMPMSLSKRLYYGIADHIRLRAISWIMSFNILGFGIIMLLNPEVMHLPGRTRLYSGLLQFGTEKELGYLCVLLGVARLASLFVNGTFPNFVYSPHIRALCSFTCSLFWFQILIGAVLCDKLVLAVDVFSTFFVLDTYSLYVAAVDIEPHTGKNSDGG